MFLRAQIQRVYSTESRRSEIERIGGTHHKTLRTHEIRIRDRKGPSRGVIQAGEPHERNPCATRFEERTPEETSRQGRLCPQSSVGFGEKKYTSSKMQTKLRSVHTVEIKAAVLVSRNTEERMFVVDAGASMHMLRKKDLSSD